MEFFTVKMEVTVLAEDKEDAKKHVEVMIKEGGLPDIITSIEPNEELNQAVQNYPARNEGLKPCAKCTDMVPESTLSDNGFCTHCEGDCRSFMYGINIK